MTGDGGRTSYNEVIQNTTNEQMLLNIVRLRYFESPFFMDVSTVTSQFTYRSAVSPSLLFPGFNQDNPAGLSGDFSWQNQPTIQYSPLEGNAFASQLMSPVEIKTLQQLIYTGWDIDRLFRLAVQSMNDIPNAPLAAAPGTEEHVEFEKFYEVTALLRKFQLQMQLQVGIISQNGNGNHGCLQVSFPDGSSDARRLAKLLGHAKTRNGRYLVNLELGFSESGTIGILPRSVLGCMYYASLGVDVPKYDQESGQVECIKVADDMEYQWDKDFGKLLLVRFCNKEPKHAYVKVFYRGKWFFIDDTDLNSKKTFVLLQQLYNLQSIDQKTPPPILSIPLGV